MKFACPDLGFRTKIDEKVEWIEKKVFLNHLSVQLFLRIMYMYHVDGIHTLIILATISWDTQFQVLLALRCQIFLR